MNPVRLEQHHQRSSPAQGTRTPVPPPAGPGRHRRLSAQWWLEGPGWDWLRPLLDVLMLSLAVGAALLGARSAGVSSEGQEALLAFPPVVMALLALRGSYRRQMRAVILDAITPVVGAISIGAMVIIGFSALTRPEVNSSPLVARAWFFAVLYVAGGRVLLALTQRWARELGLVVKPALIVGAGVVGAHVVHRLQAQPEYGLRPVGFLDADPPETVERSLPVLGGPDELAEVAERTGARHVILSFSSAPDRGLIPLARRCDELGLEVSLVPRLFESINERIALEHLGGLPLLRLRTTDPKGRHFAIKHTLDRAVAAVTLLVISPVLVPIALAVRLTSPGPVLFRQRRVGRDGQVFDLLKFRSMQMPEPGEPGFVPELGSAPGGVEGADRRTPVGRLLRRTSLDELPQLINVLRGEMSLVGPRPERPEFVELFRNDVDRYADRHRVKSGITGWAQVHGLRGQTSLADRVEWDNYYIENWSLGLDLKILLMTCAAIARESEPRA